MLTCPIGLSEKKWITVSGWQVQINSFSLEHTSTVQVKAVFSISQKKEKINCSTTWKVVICVLSVFFKIYLGLTSCLFVRQQMYEVSVNSKDWVTHWWGGFQRPLAFFIHAARHHLCTLASLGFSAIYHNISLAKVGTLLADQTRVCVTWWENVIFQPTLCPSASATASGCFF